MCLAGGGGRLFSRTRQSLICFPLGWEGRDRSNFFSAAPWEKNRPNLGARLKINPPPREFANGWSADKRLEGSNLEETKQSVTHKALQICRGSPASPPCSSENALCSGQHCHADRHTHACPKKLQRMSRGEGGVFSSTEKHWPPLYQKDTPHTRPPAWSGRQL